MTLEELSVALSGIVWGNPLIIILLGAGVYFTVSTKFVQIRHIKRMWNLLFIKNENDKGVSSFQAFALSVAGRVGTGNISGVATAILFGGPGAMFWMWALASLGSATSLIECTLGQIYKKEIDGEYRGGPAYYFEQVSGKRIIGVLFSVIAIISMTVFMPGIQSNSISSAIANGFFPNAQNIFLVKLICGIGVALLIASIVFGGTKRLSRSAEIIVPIMSIVYMIFAFIIILINIEHIPGAFGLIFKEAFSPRAGLGGALGTAVICGVKRGMFSNEAGQGTGPHAAAAANVQQPIEQGLVQAFSVYFDTLLVCTATGLMLIVTDSYNLFNSSEELIYQGANVIGLGPADGPMYTQSAISTLLGGKIGPMFVAVALFFFAFTSIMSYYYIAESNVAYLSSKYNPKTKCTESSSTLIFIARFVFLATTIFFSCVESTVVWNFTDVGVGMMAWYNVVGILFIGGIALKVLKDYDEQLKAGVKEPVFDPKKLGLNNCSAWDRGIDINK